ncbi:MAG: GAF domain-containing protein [Gammaproteobacteria bacterium]|nr:GAF domain-containing protein [Gammaproteobacteria bacterium]
MNSSYQLLLKQAQALISGESDPIANAANLASLVYNNLDNVNWVGFYFLRGDELVLGPFSGQPACTRIPIGKGVCGTAFAEQKTQLVADVHQFPGHIACDAASESEVVVPFKSKSVSGVFDIDSPVLNRFTCEEVELLEAVCELYLKTL